MIVVTILLAVNRMTQLSICMPSNRSWDRSRTAIESALAYARRTGAELIVCDNSRDPEKRRHLERLSANLVYRVSPHDDAAANWMMALSLADRPFLLPMGDDDELHFSDDGNSVDLSVLPADVVGLRPQTQIWTAKDGVCRTECFTIDKASPHERLLEYTEKAMGNNSIYYSIYRSEVFLPLLRFFTQAHPTGGGYCDWALSFALMTAGRILHDPSLIYRYDMTGWATAESIATASSNLYEQAGLPADAEKFVSLLRFLDIHIFTLRPSLALTPDERSRVLLMNGRLSLAPFLRGVQANPQNYDEVVHYLVELIRQEQDIHAIFSLAVLLTDCIKPGLKDGYVRFFQSAHAA